MHIDVNNAFLSWTAVYLLKKGYKEDIRYQEAVIGGDEKSRHGIVLAKSMVAKSRGVKTAELTTYNMTKDTSLNIDNLNTTIKSLKEQLEVSKKMLIGRYAYEKRGKSGFSRIFSKEYAKAYHDLIGKQVEQQMCRAVKLVGDFIYTCWVDADKPDLKNTK